MAHILVVSDGSLLAGLINGSLRDEGHEITHADNPLHALDITTKRTMSFDLILTDVVTQPISSFDFAKRLTIMGVKTPILFMSESRSVVSVLTGSLGRSAVIGKPFTARQLRNSVRQRLVAHGRRESQ
jgi:DNA-binding response OmpR family regulator